MWEFPTLGFECSARPGLGCAGLSTSSTPRPSRLRNLRPLRTADPHWHENRTGCRVPHSGCFCRLPITLSVRICIAVSHVLRFAMRIFWILMLFSLILSTIPVTDVCCREGEEMRAECAGLLPWSYERHRKAHRFSAPPLCSSISKMAVPLVCWLTVRSIQLLKESLYSATSRPWI